MVPLPDHEPTEPVNWLPCCSTSATAGAVVIDGPPAGTAAPLPAGLGASTPATARPVAVLKTAREVAPERACTIATRTWPRSAAPMSCVSRVSPLIALQLRSSALHRAHWKTKADG